MSGALWHVQSNSFNGTAWATHSQMSCRCKARPNPRRHGSYYKVSYVFRGRFTSRFIPRQHVKAVRAELANYKRLRKLTETWVGLALRLVKEKRKLPA